MLTVRIAEYKLEVSHIALLFIMVTKTTGLVVWSSQIKVTTQSVELSLTLKSFFMWPYLLQK